MGRVLVAAALTVAMVSLIPACSTTVVSKVPSQATQVAMGSGNVAYRASHTGQIYIYDRSSNHVRYSGMVQAGQIIIVDANNDRILVDGVPVAEKLPLDKGTHFELYLDQKAGQTATERH